MTEPPQSVRDGQLRSPFTPILETFCESCVGALASGLVDEEGECVDFAQLPLLAGGGRMQAYDVKLAGAHWQIVVRQAYETLAGPAGWGNVQEVCIHTEHFGFLIRWLHAGYCLLLLCRPDALGTISSRAVRQCELEIGHEAGWTVPNPELPYWRRVQVRLGRGTPRAMRFAQPAVAADHLPPELWDEGLRVLGPAPSITGFEKGFQVLPGGWDNPEDALTLVREQTGFWYLACPLYVLDI